MSRQNFSVAYDGEDRQNDHTIDVETLAPALLAFGKMLREANTEINGKKSKSNILVSSDFEHKCFQINFELAVSLYEQVRSLLGSEPVSTAKEVLEWVGLLKPAGVGAGGYVSYLAYLKWRNGRNAVVATQVDQSDSGTVTLAIEGDATGANIQVTQNVYNLGENPRMLKATRDAFDPIGQDGFEKIELKDASSVHEQYNSCLLYTSPSPRDQRGSRMPSSA